MIETVAAQERQELERRERAYRGSRPALEVGGKTVILVDDGIATGATLRAAVAALRSSGPDHLVVAVPVAPPATCSRLEAEVDEVVCLMTPEPFWSIGLWYEDFSQTTDAEVRELLARGQPAAARPSKPRSNL